MGFFSSKKDEPQIPLPNLALYLSSPEGKVFRPNDTISGHVELSVPYPITPQAIEVSLWGLSTVWIRTESTSSNNSTDYQHYRDYAPLFTVTYNLLPMPQVLQPGQNYAYNFNFRMPEGTANVRAGQYKKDADERFTIHPHNLPPTFFFGPFGDKRDVPDNCEISYGVTARFVSPGIGVGKNLDPVSATAPILFQPLNPHAHPSTPQTVVRYPKSFTLASSTLAGQDSSAIGFRQRIHDRFSKDTPKLDFEAALEIPDLLTSGSEFRFRASFAVLGKTDNVVQVPALLFKVLKLELLDFTFFRAPRDWKASSMMSGGHWKKDRPEPNNNGYTGQEHVDFREKKTPLNSLPDSKVVMLEDVLVSGGEKGGEKKGLVQESSCEVWFTGRVPGFTPPGFVSFAVTRAYRVRVKLGIEVGGKKFELEAENHIRALGAAP